MAKNAQFFTHPAVIQGVCTSFSYYGEVGIRGQLVIMGAKKFPYPPFYPIAPNGPTDFATDCQPESDGTARSAQNNDYEMGCVAFSPRFPNPIEFTARVKPTWGRKIVSLFHFSPGGEFHFEGMVADKFLRPRARRRFITACPFLDCIRLRKP